MCWWLEVDGDSELDEEVLEEDVDEEESLSESDDDDSSEDEEDVEELEVVAVLFGTCCITSSVAKLDMHVKDIENVPSSRFRFFPTRVLGLYLILSRRFKILLK